MFAVLLYLSPHGAMAQDSMSIGALTLSLGALSGPEEVVFGKISDVRVDARGNIYVLDERLLRLSVFNPQGVFVHSTGRGGRGPGEFRGGLSADMDDDGVLHVADGENARISRFGLSDSGSLALWDSTRLASYPIGICAMGQRRWVLQMLIGDDLIHEIGASEDPLLSFAPKEQLEGDVGRLFGESYHLVYSGASIGCDSGSETVFVVHRDQPIIRAFSPEGIERWRRTSFSDYRQMGYALSGGACCIAGIPDSESGTFHTARGAVADGSGRIWVTLQEARPRPREVSYELRAFDIPTGAELDRLPSVGFLTELRDGLAYFFVNDPYPQVFIHEIRLLP